MNKWELRGLIENEIKAIALSEIEKFYPSYLCNITGHSLEIIKDSIGIYVQEGSVELYIEYNCEECSRTLIKSQHLIEDDDLMNCKYCGNENDFAPEDGIVCLYLNEGYRTYIRSTVDQTLKKKELRKLLLA